MALKFAEFPQLMFLNPFLPQPSKLLVDGMWLYASLLFTPKYMFARISLLYIYIYIYIDMLEAAWDKNNKLKYIHPF